MAVPVKARDNSMTSNELTYVESSSVEQVAKKLGVSECLKVVNLSLFLDGDRLSPDRWIEVVSALHGTLRAPNRVIVLAHLENRQWAQIDELRLGVARVGGVLVEMRGPSFEASVDAWVNRFNGFSHSLTSSHDLKLSPQSDISTWEDYADCYLQGKELADFHDSLTQQDDEVSLPIS